MYYLKRRQNQIKHFTSFTLRWLQMGLLIVLATSGLVACGTSTDAASSTPTPKSFDTVRVGTFGVFGDAPIYIALERGYFKDEGITIANTAITGGLNELIASLASGNLDVGDGSANAALYNAFENNIHLKIVADNATVLPGDKSSAVVIRNDLVGKIKTAADLKGLKIAVLTAKGSTSLIYLTKLLAPVGLTVKDVNLVALPFPNMDAALINGSVDLAITVEPFLTLGLAKKDFSVFKYLSDIYPNAEGNVTVYTDTFAGKKDLANRFAIARLKGARDYYNAFFKNQDRDAIVKILTKYTTVKDPTLYTTMNFTPLNTDGRVNGKVIQDDLNWFVQDGDVTKSLNINSVIDNSFVDNAVRVLGPYHKS